MHATCFIILTAKQENSSHGRDFGTTTYSLTGSKKPGGERLHPHQG